MTQKSVTAKQNALWCHKVGDQLQRLGPLSTKVPARSGDCTAETLRSGRGAYDVAACRLSGQRVRPSPRNGGQTIARAVRPSDRQQRQHHTAPHAAISRSSTWKLNFGTQWQTIFDIRLRTNLRLLLLLLAPHPPPPHPAHPFGNNHAGISSGSLLLPIFHYA